VTVTNLRIDRADPDHAGLLTALAHAAKGHWGYGEELLALWREDLTFTPDYITQRPVYAARAADRIVRVHALGGSGAEQELEHLWVHPEFHGRGIGRALLDHACDTARSVGGQHLKIVSDPHAEGFYRRMGARRVGEVPSRPEARRFPLLRLPL
jgi:GNAT superfamily N-acetyltransferase